MALKADQKVTVITFDQTRKDENAMCTTYNKTWIKKLDALCKSNPEQFKCVAISGFDGSKSYFFPKKYIKPPRAPRVVSPEQKQKNSERMKKLHAEGKL